MNLPAQTTPAQNGAPSGPKIFRVAEITRLIKSVLEDEIGEVWIEGEISNFRRPASGHLYFTLKDAHAQIAAVMFRGSQTGLSFQLADGLLVRVYGPLSVYEKNGAYQIVVRQIIRSGEGALQAAFEALKKQLAAEGLFDAVRKKPLPLLPRHIAIVTSPTGAALRDIVKVLGRRFANLHLVLAPVRVQGAEAAGEIVAALDELNARGGYDLIILGRGGGSLEDLWSFNSADVARAIARSAIPVISAVGHETDFTISDFVADCRAPTPSAAAELAVREKAVLETQLAEIARRLQRNLQQQFREMQQRLLAISRSHVFREPTYAARHSRDRIERLRLQMQHRLESYRRELQQRTDDLSQALERPPREGLHLRRLRLQRLEALLRNTNPLAVLERGYSITSRPDGQPLKDASQLQPGERVSTRLARGRFEAEVV